jgi:sulfiredoxin
MATTDTAVQSEARTIAIDRLHVPNNVRALDQAHVDALAGSIALQGQIVPVIVRSDGENYVLVAGFHRYAAAVSSGSRRSPTSCATVRPKTPIGQSRTSPASSSTRTNRALWRWMQRSAGG